MKKVMTIFGAILFASVILTSCSNDGSLVTELEKCLGETKTLEQLEQLSKDEAVKMAQCMLPHIESFQTELDNNDGEAREALIESFNAKVKNSEYKEVLNAMDPDKIKELAESETSSSSAAGSEDWDAVLKSYESYIDQYIKLMKKAKNGDASAMTEYVEMMEKATDLSEKMESAGDDLSTAQMNKFLKLQTKLANAAMEMY